MIDRGILFFFKSTSLTKWQYQVFCTHNTKNTAHLKSKGVAECSAFFKFRYLLFKSSENLYLPLTFVMLGLVFKIETGILKYTSGARIGFHSYKVKLCVAPWLPEGYQMVPNLGHVHSGLYARFTPLMALSNCNFPGLKQSGILKGK